MKNVTALLRSADLTPRERFLMLIKNDFQHMKTGKDVLTEADREALENWQAKNTYEVNDWNRLLEGWKYLARMDVEIEITFLNTQTEHFRKQPISLDLLFYPFYREMRGCIQTIEKMKKVTVKEAVEIAEKQKAVKLDGGMDFDYALYMIAFESLNDSLKKDILALYPDAETETDYLDHEEILADLLDGKDTLSKKDVERLGELVAEHSYNPYAKEYQLYHYFADIPILEVAKRCATEKGLKTKKSIAEADDIELRDLLKKYAEDKKTTVEKILKETVVSWFEEGLPYIPLVISDEKKTMNDIDTSLPHREVFKEWMKAKGEAKKTLQKFIDSGSLKTRNRTEKEMKHDAFVNELKRQKLRKKVKGNADSNIIIIGESLYSFDGEYKFVKEFKERVDEYDPNLGIVYKNDDHDRKGDHMDRELVICGLNDKGDSHIFSMFGMSIDILSKLIEATTLFEESEKDGETFLEFKDDSIKQTFKGECKSLVDGYAKLLAFEELLKKMSRIYEVDLDCLIKGKLKYLEKYIDDHNELLRLGMGRKRIGEELDADSRRLFGNRAVLKTKDDLFIDKEGIKLDQTVIDEHATKLGGIFGSEFSMT